MSIDVRFLLLVVLSADLYTGAWHPELKLAESPLTELSLDGLFTQC